MFGKKNKKVKEFEIKEIKLVEAFLYADEIFKTRADALDAQKQDIVDFYGTEDNETSWYSSGSNIAKNIEKIYTKINELENKELNNAQL